MTGSQRLFGPPPVIAERIKQAISQKTSLTASVGVASCKLVAKIASDLHKPDGLTVVEPGREAAFLRPLPVAKMWGIGPKAAAQLARLGVRTIGELAALPEALLVRIFGAAYAPTVRRHGQGLDPRPVEPEPEPKSISQERTFAEDLRELGELERHLLAFAEAVTAELRTQRLLARTVVLKLRTPDFRTLTRRRTLEAPTETSSCRAGGRRSADAATPPRRKR